MAILIFEIFFCLPSKTFSCLLFLVWNFLICMVFRLVSNFLTTPVLLQFFMPYNVYDGLWDARCLGCRTFRMLDVWNAGRRDVGCLRCDMFGMWDVRGVGYLGCGIFRIWNVWDVECSGCGMFGMRDVRDMECLGCGMWVFAGIRYVVLQHANCLAWSGSYRLYLPLKFLLIFTNGFTHTYSKRQKSISFYKYLIFRLNWIARQFLLFLFYALNNN